MVPEVVTVTAAPALIRSMRIRSGERPVLGSIGQVPGNAGPVPKSSHMTINWPGRTEPSAVPWLTTSRGCVLRCAPELPPWNRGRTPGAVGWKKEPLGPCSSLIVRVALKV